MKKIFQICSILVTTILLFSCASQTTEYGTLTLQLPSGETSRAAVNVDSLTFNIEVTNQETQESQKETGAAGGSHSIELPAGKYTIKMDAFTAENKEKPFYTGSVTDVEVTPGETVKVPLTLHEVQTATVVFSVKAGAVKYGTKVELSSTTKNAKIYYTTDGSDPITSSSKAEYKEAIVIKNNATIKAYAKAENSDASAVTSEEYKIATVKPGVGVEMQKQVTKGDLVMEVEEDSEVEGESTVTLTVKFLTEKSIKSCSWLINGVPAKNETPDGMITQVDPETGETTEVPGIIYVITINENTVVFSPSTMSEVQDIYNINRSGSVDNFITCIVETADGDVFDVSYGFSCGA